MGSETIAGRGVHTVGSTEVCNKGSPLQPPLLTGQLSSSSSPWSCRGPLRISFLDGSEHLIPLCADWSPVRKQDTTEVRSTGKDPYHLRLWRWGLVVSRGPEVKVLQKPVLHRLVVPPNHKRGVDVAVVCRCI